MKNKLIILAFALLAIACKQDKNTLTVTSEETKDYLLAYTRGMIHEDEPILFQFVQDVDLETEAIAQAVHIEPNVPIQVDLSEASKTLSIRPSEHLKRGEKYTIHLNLGKLIKNAKDKSIKTELKVHQQYVTVKRKGLVIDANGHSYLELNVSTSIPEGVNEIRKLFKVDENQIKIYQEDDFNFIAKIQNNANVKTIDWSAKHLQSSDEGSILTFGGNMDKFTILNTYFNREKGILTAYFTKTLKKKQDLTGLITIGNQSKPKYEIKQNQIKVFVNSTMSEADKISFKQGIRSKQGDKLKKDYQFDIEIELIQPGLEWLSDGTYISKEGQFKIPFKAKGLKSVKVAVAAIPTEQAAQFASWNNITSLEKYELIRYGDFIYETEFDLSNRGVDLTNWNEFGLDFSKHFQRNPGYIYRVYMNYSPSQTILTCENEALKNYEVEILEKHWFEESGSDYRYYDYYDYEEEENPCSESFYYSLSPIVKNVHCTNVFPIMKYGGDELTVAAKELLNTKLAKGAQVSVLNLQGREIDQKSIGNSGVVQFTNLNHQPRAIKVNYRGDISYFSITDGDENLMTEFDVSSSGSEIDNQLFVYSERDVRRPGDTIFLNVMLNHIDHKFPEGLPMTMSLDNSRGVQVKKMTQNIKKDQIIYSFKVPTSIDDETGIWRAYIQVGPERAVESIRIETIKPNVVEAKYDLDGQEKNKIYNNELRGTVSVNYLAGYPMKGGTVEASANIFPEERPFKAFQDYRMTDYDVDYDTDVNLFETETDQSGNISLHPDIDFKEYESVSRVYFDTQINLPGGGLNTQSTSFLISPFESYVGIKKLGGTGWRGSYSYGEIPKFEFVHVNQEGQLKTGSSSVKATLYKAKKDWWYDRYRLSNNHRVHSEEYYEEVKSFDVVFRNGKASYQHDTKANESGLYVLRLEDEDSEHHAEYRFHSITTNDYQVEKNPVFIPVPLEKTTYKIGESFNLKLPTLNASKAFVSIERGNKVLESFWVDLANPNLTLTARENWYPNVYLNVNVVQNYAQTNNDRPLRMYGVQKIKISNRKTILEPVLKMPEKVQPNKTFTVKVNEKKGQPMDYTLAVVDRGLLNLTGFQTPSPLAYFSKEVALLLRTWDIYDELIDYNNPAFAGVLSIGGDDMEVKLDESADFNRFKPVVVHLGPFQLKAKQTKTHQITLPNYIGRLQVMVVAGSQNTFGSSTKHVRVASPLMLQSQLPRALNVSDKVTLPVTLFKDEKSIKTASLTASSDKNLLTFTPKTVDVKFADNDQEQTNMELTVGEQSGKTKIQLNAQSGKYKSNEETTIFVNYPNGYEEKTTYYELQPNQKERIDIDCFGFNETKHVKLTTSSMILPAFAEYYESLIQYPYGCLEQTSSKGYGLLYVGEMMDLSPKEKSDMENYLEAALAKITRFQNSDGSFRYWESGTYHQWADLYAGHFLAEAKERGVEVNEDVLRNWTDFTLQKANRWRVEGVSESTQSREELIQAYRLYILAKLNVPAKSAMNRFKNRTLNNQFANVFLGGAYLYSGMNDLGKEIFYKGINESNTTYNYATFGSTIRNEAIVLMLLSQFEKGDRVNRYYQNFVQKVNQEHWLSTQEKGFAIMACRYYFGKQAGKANQEVKFDISSKAHQQNRTLKKNTAAVYTWLPNQIKDEAIIENQSEGKLFITKTERAISKELYKSAESDNLSLIVTYTDLNGNEKNLNRIQQGDDIRIQVQVKNLDIQEQNSLALSVKMPSGWELLNPRMLKTSKEKNDGSFEYQDYRDEKVYTYFSLRKNQTKTFRFRAKANLKGEFYLPSIRCEHMYQGSVKASTQARRTIVQ